MQRSDTTREKQQEPLEIRVIRSTEQTPLLPKATIRRELVEAIMMLSEGRVRRSKPIVSSGISIAFLLAAGGLIADGVRRHYTCGGIVDACLEYAPPEFVMGTVSAIVSCIAGVTASSSTPADYITVNNQLKNAEIERLNELGEKYSVDTGKTRLIVDVLMDFKRRATENGITYQEYSAGLFPSAVVSAPAAPSVLPVYVQPAAGPANA